MENNNNPGIAELEALLFHYGEPLDPKSIGSYLEINEDQVAKLISELEISLNENKESALTLITLGKQVQLVTKPELKWVNQKVSQGDLKESLTPVALETLALIAYLSPITRSMIDFIRGVNTSFTIRSLLMRGLITRETNPKGGYEYKISVDCLHHLNIKNISELPEYDKYREILTSFEMKNSEQEQAPPKINNITITQ